jgi:hypothetical protein
VACAGRDPAADLLLLALLAAACVLLLHAPFSPNRLGDLDFYQEARGLAGALRSGQGWEQVAISKAPGPVLFYALPFLALAPDASDARAWLAAVLASMGGTALAILLLRRTAARLAGRWAGRWTGLLALALPLPVYYSLGVLAEPPAFLGTALLLWGWVNLRAEGAAGRVTAVSGAWAAAGLCLLVLCRPNAVLVLPLALLAALRLGWRRRADAEAPVRRRLAVATATLVAAVLAVLVGVHVLLPRLPGRRAGLRQGAYLGYVLLQGRFQYRHEPWNWTYWDQDRAGTPDYDQWLATQRALEAEAAAAGLSVDRLRRRWVLRDTVGHPWLTLRMAAVRALTLHLLVVHSARPEAFALGPLPGALVYALAHVLVNGLFWGILGCACFGLWQRRAELAALWPLPAVWLALFLFSAFTYAEPRYLFPAQPCVLVLAGCGLACFLHER